MDFNTWFLVVGAVMTMLALSTSLLTRLPIPAALPYLVVGVAIGPLGIGLLEVLPIQQATLIERLSEIAVSLSLFAAGSSSAPGWTIRCGGSRSGWRSSP
jgi:sodium/hydrogen antiporter